MTGVTNACPDRGTCHHNCTNGCFRVVCCGPLSVAKYPDNQWPSKLHDAHANAIAWSDRDGANYQPLEFVCEGWTVACAYCETPLDDGESCSCDGQAHYCLVKRVLDAAALTTHAQRGKAITAIARDLELP